jgi:alanine-synthesizing transaminase
LLKHAHVAVSPGLGFGEYGDGHVRIAVVENTQRIRQATRNLKQLLSDPEKAIAEAGDAAQMSIAAK